MPSSTRGPNRMDPAVHVQNLEMAREVERIVRSHGATPATVAILGEARWGARMTPPAAAGRPPSAPAGGVPHVGLTDTQLEHLAREGPKVDKCSRRDLARVMALGRDGATTVSGTMVLAHAAGVRVFVTGGIGGVHRKGEARRIPGRYCLAPFRAGAPCPQVTMDVSADLTELGRTPVLVVCAGAK